MKTKFKVLALVTVLIFACSKKDDDLIPDEEPQVENYLSVDNSSVKTFEVININVSNVSLNTSYQAKLGDENVELNKIDETTLTLFIPYLEDGIYMLDTELGELELSISQTKLSAPKEEVINGFKSRIEANFTPTAGVSNSKGAKILDDILKGASEDEKQAIALFFEANKKVFNEIITADFNKNANSSKVLAADSFDELKKETKRFIRNVLKITAGVAAIAIGKEIVVGGVATGGLVSIGGAIIGGAGVAVIYDTLPLVKQNMLTILNIGFNTEDFELNNGVSNKGSKTASTLTFTNKISRTLPFKQTDATLSQSSSSNSNSTIASFFDAFSKFSTVINTINAAINLANKIPFVNIDKLEVLTIPATPKKEELNVETENYTNYSFSVSNDKVKPNISLAEKGKLKITFTAEESVDFTKDLEFDLKIDFNDNLNTISKTYKIKLQGENPIFGEWEAISYNGKNMGETTEGGYNEKCKVYLENYSINSSLLKITESDIILNFNQTTSNVSYSSDANGVIECSSIVIKNETYSGSDSYKFSEFPKKDNANIYKNITTFSDGQVTTVTIELINNNQLKFTNRHKDTDQITRTALLLIYNRK